MSKYSKLITKKEALEAKAEKLDLELCEEKLKIDDELDTLLNECINGIEELFENNDIKIYVKCDESGVYVYLGTKPKDVHISRSGICVFQYRADYYICQTEFITSEIGYKIRDLYIEYFGKL